MVSINNKILEIIMKVVYFRRKKIIIGDMMIDMKSNAYLH